MAKQQVTVRLEKTQLARARKALGGGSITQTIERALEFATKKARHDRIVRKYSGIGRKNSFAER
jgi:hypothetical protein